MMGSSCGDRSFVVVLMLILEPDSRSFCSVPVGGFSYLPDIDDDDTSRRHVSKSPVLLLDAAVADDSSGIADEGGAAASRSVVAVAVPWAVVGSVSVAATAGRLGDVMTSLCSSSSSSRKRGRRVYMTGVVTPPLSAVLSVASMLSSRMLVLPFWMRSAHKRGPATFGFSD